MMITFDISQSGLKFSPALIRKVGGAAVQRLADMAFEKMVREVPVRTGALMASITEEVDASSLSFKVGPKAVYARFVASGTGPHMIRAVNARALRFESGGETVFARYVIHPGTRPNRFQERTLASVKSRAERVFVEEWSKEISG